MIFATIILCAAMQPDLCSETTGYKAIPIEQAFPSQVACFQGGLMMMPLLPHNPGDTYRIVCGGNYARIIGADI